MSNLKMGTSDIIRLTSLGVLVLLEGFAVVSLALNIVFLPVPMYPNIASVTLLVLPVAFGVLSQRFEVAIVLTVLPFFVLAVVYTAVYAPVWNIDVFQLGVLAGRVAGVAILLGGLGWFGWLLRRIFVKRAVS